MFAQFARLAGRMLMVDVSILEDSSNRVNKNYYPDLISAPYLRTYSHMLRQDETPHIGHNLDTYYNWDWAADVLVFRGAFEEKGTLETLTRLVIAQSQYLGRNPKLAEYFTEPCRIVDFDVEQLSGASSNIIYQRNLSPKARQILAHGFAFLKAMVPTFEQILQRYGSSISAESVTSHLFYLTNIYTGTLVRGNQDSEATLDDFRRNHPEIVPTSQHSKAVVYTWKLSLLYKLITSNQMQFRIIGVTTMSSDLLKLYKDEKGHFKAPHNAFLQHFANQLLQTDILDHILGASSHPELIAESNNIIGFLIATKAYTNRHTDSIWHTVMFSQDPRVVSATLRAFLNLLQQHELSQLYYICEKIKEAPLRKFTPAMCEFCGKLLEQIINRKQTEGMYEILPEPYDLCIRLVRESLEPGSDGAASYSDLSAFALQRLQILLQFGPVKTARREMGTSCVQDLACGSSTSWGSICILNLLMRQYPEEIRDLVTEHNLTTLIVQRLEESNLTRKASTTSTKTPDFDLSAACLESLLFVIDRQPESINANLGQRLWTALVGDRFIPAVQRQNAWVMLNNVLRKSHNNVFLQSCFNSHFSELPPECFLSGTLEFAKEMIGIWLEQIRIAPTEAEQHENLPALEQLWRMLLLSPHNTIEMSAIRVLVSVYVDSDFILTMPRIKARAMHQSLVDRCLKQLQSAASRLPTMTSTSWEEQDSPSAATRRREETVFARSLAVLHEFFRAYQKKPQFALPKPISLGKATTAGPQGEPVKVKYQSFDGNTSTDVKTLSLGRLSTAGSLLAGIQEATGFKNYKVYYRGKAFDPAEIDVCQSLGDMNLSSDSGLLLIQRKDLTEGASSAPVVSLEAEIVSHLPTLWQYLGIQGRVAQEIYHFLIKFPTYSHVTDRLHNKAFESLQVFPPGQPFTSLYAAHVLRLEIVRREDGSQTRQAFLDRALCLMISVMSRGRDKLQTQVEEVDARLIISLTECCVLVLHQSDSPQPSLLNAELCDELLRLMQEWQLVSAYPHVTSELICRVFDFMLEVSRYSQTFWTQFASHLKRSHMLRELIVENDHPLLRDNITKQISQRCSVDVPGTETSNADFLRVFWPLVASLIAEVIQRQERGADVFGLALGLFRELHLDGDSISSLVNHWSQLLVQSNLANYSAGRVYDSVDAVDPVAFGLSNLIHTAALTAKTLHKALACGDAGFELFKDVLFPRFLDEDELAANPSPYIPILHESTRERLLEAVFVLVRDEPQHFDSVVNSLANVVPHSLQDENPYAYDLSWGCERIDGIRASTGYVGLRNLSNTCYLNSLFTQLFMNIPFRQFMLELEVDDSGGQQQLLLETQTLFAHMQNSFSRYVDPQCVADSIQTYDLSRIDVTIQMDVDEFYNLLFDRWESQLAQIGLKQKFKSFYGGLLVHQIKSKECDHRSEREESFAAIQCEIKGKSCLQESLQAYVEGEVMEGGMQSLQAPNYMSLMLMPTR